MRRKNCTWHPRLSGNVARGNVVSGGPYTLDARVASQGPGGVFHVELDGVDVSGPMTVPDTGGWTTWRTVTAAAAGWSMPSWRCC